MSSINYGKSTVALGKAWRMHAEPVPGYRMLGTITAKNGHVAALAVSESGQYVAVNGRYIAQLVNRKAEAAIREAMESKK